MKKILLVSLSKKFGSKIGEKLADKLSLYFLNIDDYIEYALLDTQKMLEKCGKVYYDKEELKSINESLGFENTLYFCSYEVLVNNLKLFEQNFQIFYLQLQKKDLITDANYVINKFVYEDRDNFLCKKAKTIKCEFVFNKSEVNKILEVIKVNE